MKKNWVVFVGVLFVVSTINARAAVLQFDFTDSAGISGSFLLKTDYLDLNQDPERGSYSLDAVADFSYRNGFVTGVYTWAATPTISYLSLGFDNGPWSTDLSFKFFSDEADLVNQLPPSPSDYVFAGGILYIEEIGTLEISSLTITSVPLPGALLLFLSGFLGLMPFYKKGSN